PTCEPESCSRSSKATSYPKARWSNGRGDKQRPPRHILVREPRVGGYPEARHGRGAAGSDRRIAVAIRYLALAAAHFGRRKIWPYIGRLACRKMCRQTALDIRKPHVIPP